MKMANYILNILCSQVVILMSWGFHNAAAIENGLRFNVQGFLFAGIVKVIYEGGSDTFIVRLEKADGSLYAERENVYLDSLVSVIDGLVEKDCSQEEYDAKVSAEYGFNTSRTTK